MHANLEIGAAQQEVYLRVLRFMGKGNEQIIEGLFVLALFKGGFALVQALRGGQGGSCPETDEEGRGDKVTKHSRPD